MAIVAARGDVAELSGTLEGPGLPAVFGFVAALKKTGCLQIRHQEWHADVFFREGSITNAALGSRTGLTALEAIVEVFPEAQFSFDSQLRMHVSDLQSIELGRDEALAHIGEVAARVLRGERRLPSLGFVPAATAPDAAGADRRVPLDQGLLETLLAVDGHRTVLEIVRQRQTLDAVWELAHLADLGLIELGPEFQPAKTAAPARCPRIGFEADPSRSFGRPTRLHRCFASNTPLPLSLDQQRDLCLSEQFGTCPRMLRLPLPTPAALPVQSPPDPESEAPVAESIVAVRHTRARRPMVARAIFGLVVVVVGTVAYMRAPSLLTRSVPEDAGPTQIVVAGATSAPTPLFDEHFTNNAANWVTNPQGPAVLTYGAYRMATRQAGRFAAISAPLANVPSDVVISATFRKLAGPPGGGYGIIVRDQSEAGLDGVTQNGRFYVLEVGDKGEVGIWRRDSDHWTDLQSWQHSDSVKTGTATNDVTVRAVGNTLSLAVNGTVAAVRSDSVLTGGSAGLFVGGDGNQVSVTHFAIESP